MHRYSALFAFISTALCGRSILDQGVAALKSGNYPQARELFQKELSLHPDDPEAHFYFGTTYMAIWMAGDLSPENTENARAAEKEFRRALELNPSSKTALTSMAELTYKEAVLAAGEEKSRKLDESLDWYRRLVVADPANQDALFLVASITWEKFHRVLADARKKVGTLLSEPNPLPNPQRQELKTQYSALLDEAIGDLERKLVLDPHHSEAMSYMHLLIRDRAALRDTREEYLADVAVANAWAQKSLDARAAGPPAPPLVRVQFARITKRVEPIYPPLAKQARVSGQVRFTLIIAKDGTVRNVELISGHPLLVPSALEAVKQYVYVPVLLNGEPVEAITQADVNFTLRPSQ
jgi:TonB family protein